ncbi:concanavalin A-like lectin/glucanase domain-containing protein [Gorgonomyces haynaldii]|nr:concanavalin A-like lectin/glucanase domain-containing protein [Gorgonomyces haynaldii]
MLASLFAAAVAAQNCKSGRYKFDPARIWSGPVPAGGLDPNKYDFTIDYGFTSGPTPNIEYTANGINLNIVKQTGTATSQGIRLSTVRTVLYAKITAKFAAVAQPGVVTTLITMSKEKDEIDIETVGKDTSHFQSVVFYKGIEERGPIHQGVHSVPGSIAQPHEYTIDWRNDKITWGVDGTIQREYKNDANAVSPMTPPGQRWFPNTASQVQFSVWESTSTDWAGGPINWGSNTKFTAQYEYIDIQCYDGMGNLPISGNNATTTAATTAAATTAPTASALPQAPASSPNSAKKASALLVVLASALLL